MRQVYTAKIDADMGSQTGYLVESECLGKEESKQAIKQHQNLGRNCRMNNLRKQIGASRPGSYFL